MRSSTSKNSASTFRVGNYDDDDDDDGSGGSRYFLGPVILTRNPEKSAREPGEFSSGANLGVS